MKDVEQACRKARFVDQLTEAVRGQRRDFGRLRNDGVAHQEGWRDLPRQQIQRKVPRGNQADHPDGFAQHVVHCVVHRERLLRRGPAKLSKEPEVAHAPVDVHMTGHVPRFAGVEGFQFGEVVGVCFHHVSDCVQHAGPFLDGPCTPCRLCRFCSDHSVLDVVVG